MLRIVLRAVERELREHCPGAPPGARTGAVSFIQRFGGALNTHLHYHCCVGPATRIDGVFSLDEAGGDPSGTLRFHPADPLDEAGGRPAVMYRLQELLRRRILKHFQRQGLLEAGGRPAATWRRCWDGGTAAGSPVAVPPGRLRPDVRVSESRPGGTRRA